MNNILLIGGGGYVGTAITKTFLNEKKKILVMDNFIYDHKKISSIFENEKNYTYKKFDIRHDKIDPHDISKIDHVIILAGLVGDPITKKYPELSYSINVSGIKKTLKDLSNYSNFKSIIFVSTCSNYGILEDGQIADEKSKLSPISLYAKAKVEIENYFSSLKFNSSKFILRFATAFGLSPRMRFDLTLNEFTRNLYFNKFQEVYDYDTWRPYCHLQDFAKTFNLIFDKYKKFDFEIFNVGSNKNNYTKKMLSDLIKDFVPGAIVEYSNMSQDRRDYKVSFEKINSKLSFDAKFSIADGIEEIINSFKSGDFHDSIDNRINYGNYYINKIFH